jgi:hypothetical protein
MCIAENNATTNSGTSTYRRSVFFMAHIIVQVTVL